MSLSATTASGTWGLLDRVAQVAEQLAQQPKPDVKLLLFRAPLRPAVVLVPWSMSRSNTPK